MSRKLRGTEELHAAIHHVGGFEESGGKCDEFLACGALFTQLLRREFRIQSLRFRQYRPGSSHSRYLAALYVHDDEIDRVPFRRNGAVERIDRNGKFTAQHVHSAVAGIDAILRKTDCSR